jgi:hypothetical protein
MGWQGLTIYDVRRNPTLWERHKISLRSFEPTNEEPSFVTLLRAQHGFLISEVRLFPLCLLHLAISRGTLRLCAAVKSISRFDDDHSLL